MYIKQLDIPMEINGLKIMDVMRFFHGKKQGHFK